MARACPGPAAEQKLQRRLEHGGASLAAFGSHARTLFAAMKPGGPVGFECVAWFDVALTDHITALPLERYGVTDLLAAAAMDASEIDPTILATRFKRGLDAACGSGDGLCIPIPLLGLKDPDTG